MKASKEGGGAHERTSPKGKGQKYPPVGTRPLLQQRAHEGVLVYHDNDESIYFEHRGKESGVVRFTFEMIEGLKIVEEAADSQE